MSISSRLLNRRLQLGLVQKEVAHQVGITAQYLGQIEKGKRTPTPETLADICRVYSISSDYIIGLIDRPLPIQREQFSSATLSTREKGASYDVDVIQELIWLMSDLPEGKQRAIVEIAKVVAGL